MNIADLHALFASRAIVKARSFLRQGLGAGATTSIINGAGTLSKSPNGPGGFGGGALSTSAINVEVNRRDHLGRTVLHLAASELADWALEWVEILLAVPGLHVNAVDAESGWSALHRALYAGNISAARLIFDRSDVDPRLKDHEGLTPFDVYNSTVDGTNPRQWARDFGTDATNCFQGGDLGTGRNELHTWGNNRNFVLGFSGDGDRTYPERVPLSRREGGTGLSAFDPVRVLDISMARLHTAIVTDETRNNIRLCGYGTGGRLGPTLHTQFHFTPLHDFPHQVAVAVVSPDHSLVVTTSGAVWTFGLNRFGQLGYALDAPSSGASSGCSGSRSSGAADDLTQSVPRRVLGVIKKEAVIGAAVSRTHSAVFTSNGDLFTWGTNKGQLGYPASGTTVQVLPRKVTSITSPVAMLTTTECATACLLAESKDVVVLYAEGYIRIAFPLTPFPSKMQPYRPPNVSDKPTIRKIASCGTTFAALSTLGDVFTWTFDGFPASTNAVDSPPNFSRLAPKPQRIWSLRRALTAVTDLGVGLDGTIILCTVSGHCFVRNKKFEAQTAKSGRSTPTLATSKTSNGGWKFTKVPFLQRCVRVAANSTGGFAALRSDVPLRPIDIEGLTLAEDLLGVLPHWLRSEAGMSFSKHERAVQDEDDEDAATQATVERGIQVAKRLMQVLATWSTACEVHVAGTDLFLIPNQGQRIPVHRAMLAVRSPRLLSRIAAAPPDAAELAIDCSVYSALLLIHYLYQDEVPAVWDLRIGHSLQAAFGSNLAIGVCRQELQQLASDLELPALAEALGYQARMAPSSTLSRDIMTLLQCSLSASRFASPSLEPDIVLALADRDIAAHSLILRARCPFFRVFFDENVWTMHRRDQFDGKIRFSLQHIEWSVMGLVLDHIYGDAGMSLFRSLDRATADDYIDFTTKVLAVANELLLDKLKAVCSAVLRSFITLRNVCAILSDAIFYEATDLARTCMYYLASSMETALENRLLDDLAPELLKALTDFVQERQGNKMPIARSGYLVNDLMAKHAAFVADLDIGRPTGGARRWRPAVGNSSSPRPSPNLLSPGPSPLIIPRSSPILRSRQLPSPTASPSMPAHNLEPEDMFAMDEDFSLDSVVSAAKSATASNPDTPGPPPIRRRLVNTVPVLGSASPGSSNFTTLGSPPPPRLQPWTKTTTTTHKPVDLRSIISAEALISTTPPTAAGARPLPTSAVLPLPNTSPNPALSSPSGWRPVASTSPSSLSEIQAQQSLRAPPRVAASRPVDSSRGPVTRHLVSALPSSISMSRPAPTVRTNPASAIGAPVYTPTQAPSGSIYTSRGGFSGADVPWTNYTLASPQAQKPAPPLPSASSDPFAVSPVSSFAAIQSQQRREIEQVREGRAVRSLAEVMDEERQQARQHELEVKQERDFETWFEEESRRFQMHSGGGALPSALSGRGGRGGSSRRSEGRKPARGGGTAADGNDGEVRGSSRSGRGRAAKPIRG
ncbi:BQ2448_5753 [Microbotryum intermedium]|uniref:BQ2448_5753 protein n=1 Tax=Microbotryum intermedium TaxID=269621 RepID=A0A238F243_9BASI|nr:BQ2448_5753 [Microbotryum intermedium]